MRAARQAAAGQTRRRYDRSFGGSKRRLSLKFRPDIVVVARGPAYAIDQKPPSRAAG
jgi:hypothetical protein